MKRETEEKRVEREAAWAEKELSEKEKAERAEQRYVLNYTKNRCLLDRIIKFIIKCKYIHKNMPLN